MNVGACRIGMIPNLVMSSCDLADLVTKQGLCSISVHSDRFSYAAVAAQGEYICDSSMSVADIVDIVWSVASHSTGESCDRVSSFSSPDKLLGRPSDSPGLLLLQPSSIPSVESPTFSLSSSSSPAVGLQLLQQRPAIPWTYETMAE